MKLMEMTRPPDYGFLLGNHFNAGLEKTYKTTPNANKPPAEMNVREEPLRHPDRSSKLQIRRSDVINDKERLCNPPFIIR
jgi:hypothetical protein